MNDYYNMNDYYTEGFRKTAEYIGIDPYALMKSAGVLEKEAKSRMAKKFFRELVRKRGKNTITPSPSTPVIPSSAVEESVSRGGILEKLKSFLTAREKAPPSSVHPVVDAAETREGLLGRLRRFLSSGNKVDAGSVKPTANAALVAERLGTSLPNMLLDSGAMTRGVSSPSVRAKAIDGIAAKNTASLSPEERLAGVRARGIEAIARNRDRFRRAPAAATPEDFISGRIPVDPMAKVNPALAAPKAPTAPAAATPEDFISGLIPVDPMAKVNPALAAPKAPTAPTAPKASRSRISVPESRQQKINTHEAPKAPKAPGQTEAPSANTEGAKPSAEVQTEASGSNMGGSSNPSEYNGWLDWVNRNGLLAGGVALPTGALAGYGIDRWVNREEPKWYNPMTWGN